MFGRGKPMFGGPPEVTEPVWPQPHPYTTDLAKAKQLLAEAGYPDGFETTLSFDLGFAVTNEPLCILVQESLAQIGIKATLNKIPGANWRAEFSKKTLPFITNAFGGWLNYPGILLLLDLSRAERDLQHDVLPEPGDGQADRRRAVRNRPAEIQGGGRGLYRHRLRRRCRASRCSSRISTWRCRRTSPATATGSIASSTTAS